MSAAPRRMGAWRCRRPRTFLEAAGAELRERRVERGLRLVDVAERAGMTAGQVSRLERGQRRPRPATLARVLELLGLTLPELRRAAELRLRPPL